MPSQRSERSEETGVRSDGIGVSAAGRRGVNDADARSRCKSGIRFGMGWVDAGKSWARAIGRNAERKAEEGARRAAIAVDGGTGWFSRC